MSTVSRSFKYTLAIDVATDPGPTDLAVGVLAKSLSSGSLFYRSSDGFYELGSDYTFIPISPQSTIGIQDSDGTMDFSGNVNFSGSVII